jgi:hypothetical protein
METAVKCIPIRNQEAYDTTKNELISELNKITIPRIRKTYISKYGTKHNHRDLVIGRIGRTENFGITKTRTKGYALSRFSKKHPTLLTALINFGNHCVPKDFEYNAITLNHNVLAKKHTDKYNVGEGIIVGIGDYDDGRLRVYDASGCSFTSYCLKDNAIMFNGSKYPHETEPFTGERYTIIYYTIKKDYTIEGHSARGV